MELLLGIAGWWLGMIPASWWAGLTVKRMPANKRPGEWAVIIAVMAWPVVLLLFPVVAAFRAALSPIKEKGPTRGKPRSKP